MSYKTPPSIPLKKLCSWISIYDRRFLSSTRSLTEFFKTNVVGAWDLVELTAPELLTIQENLANMKSDCIVVLKLKLHPEQYKKD